MDRNAERWHELFWEEVDRSFIDRMKAQLDAELAPPPLESDCIVTPRSAKWFDLVVPYDPDTDPLIPGISVLPTPLIKLPKACPHCSGTGFDISSYVK